MKKLSLIALAVATCLSSLSVSAVNTKKLDAEQICFNQAAQMYGDMLDFGMPKSRALRYASNYYWNCRDASGWQPSQGTTKVKNTISSSAH